MGYFKSKRQVEKTTFEHNIEDIISNEEYLKLKRFCHHGECSRFDHSVRVARLSWKISNLLHLNSRESARGAMLHDFYLYCNHEREPMEHIRSHPKDALNLAKTHFELTEREAEIILCHMWPLADRRPVYPESYIVNIADTLCAVMEYCINLKVQRSRNEARQQSHPLQPQIPYGQGL